MNRIGIGPLAARRASLREGYAKACKLHRGQGEAAERLRDATTALLKQELRPARPEKRRGPSPSRAGLPDLFANGDRP